MSTMKSSELLRKIQIYAFCAVDLNLYLDNFPDCMEAREDYCTVSAELDKLIKLYEESCGPLRNFGMAFRENPESWIEQPWPWERH